MPRGIVAQLRARSGTPSAFAMLPFQSFFEELDFDFESGEEPPKERRRLRMPGRRDDDNFDERPPGRRGPQWRRIIILVVALCVLGYGAYWYIKSCQRDQEVSAYKTYVRDMNAVTTASNGVGAKLQSAFLKQGQTPQGLEASIASLVRLQQSVVTDAQAVGTPGGMSEVNKEAIQAQQMRENGLIGLSRALPGAFKSYNQKTGVDPAQAARLSDMLSRVLAGDVVYSDSYKYPATAVLKEKNITGEASIADSQWMNDAMLEFIPPTGMSQRLVTIVGGNTTSGPSVNGGSSSSSNGNRLHGTGIKSTSVNGHVVTTTGTNIVGALDVGKNNIVTTIANSGGFQETNVTVHAYVDGSEIGKGQVIAVFGAGQTAQVTFPIEPSLDGTAQTIKIVVDQVQGETNLANNKAVYKVLFSAAG
jgi:hypothetical protein